MGTRGSSGPPRYCSGPLVTQPLAITSATATGDPSRRASSGAFTTTPRNPLHPARTTAQRPDSADKNSATSRRSSHAIPTVQAPCALCARRAGRRPEVASHPAPSLPVPAARRGVTCLPLAPLPTLHTSASGSNAAEKDDSIRSAHPASVRMQRCRRRSHGGLLQRRSMGAAPCQRIDPKHCRLFQTCPPALALRQATDAPETRGWSRDAPCYSCLAQRAPPQSSKSIFGRIPPMWASNRHRRLSLGIRRNRKRGSGRNIETFFSCCREAIWPGGDGFYSEVGTPCVICLCQWRLCLHRQVPSDLRQLDYHRLVPSAHAKNTRERREMALPPVSPPAGRACLCQLCQRHMCWYREHEHADVDAPQLARHHAGSGMFTTTLSRRRIKVLQHQHRL